jgi:predicted ATPase
VQISTLAISGYRSLRNLVVPLQRLNVITGPNGSGKSSLYRALRLLADTAQGRVVQSLAREGGLPSTLWAGPEVVSRAMKRGEVAVEPSHRNHTVSLKLGFASDEYSYLIDLGYPPVDRRPPEIRSAFALDPQIKREILWHGDTRRPSTTIADRRYSIVSLTAEDRLITDQLSAFDSMLTHVSDPKGAPELLQLRESIRAWRFYDHFRSDADAPARIPQIGTRTPILANDGADLAAAIQTIREIGDAEALRDAVEDAFPGSSVSVQVSDGLFRLAMHQHGLLRPLAAAELSDGTLRYLLWVAALLTPRPPALMVLNEPETSLHPDVLPALGRLMQRASAHSQIIAVSHSAKLLDSIGNHGVYRIALQKCIGETAVEGQTLMNTPAWHWPSRS